MTYSPLPSLDHLKQFGYALLDGVFTIETIQTLADRLSTTLEGRQEASVLRSRGQTYGSRNLLETFPEVSTLPCCPVLSDFITEVLGQSVGIVRVLYFDKPPDRSWSLPWHKDRTIAVKRNDLPSDRFRKPTFKAGVPHVEAPDSLLARMLTLRVHLDPMTVENGPLSVIPASHLGDDHAEGPAVELHANAGDVLAMRPLLTHASSNSQPGTRMHRRIIHIELASSAELPDRYEWYAFVSL